ncbi:YrzA family protein [Bacillus tuaregi]|uniref:YrzA family protein n=1 Tax=Bacillus tuaregi TaxID=1816695 RepID=UPI0008F800AA|nr:YrzA family protein [Bacillus tuaregi]
MKFQLDLIEDKVEFYEALDIKTLEKNINQQIEVNKAILLKVHSVSHQMHVDDNGRTYYSAVVHYKTSRG